MTISFCSSLSGLSRNQNQKIHSRQLWCGSRCLSTRCTVPNTLIDSFAWWCICAQLVQAAKEKPPHSLIPNRSPRIALHVRVRARAHQANCEASGLVCFISTSVHFTDNWCGYLNVTLSYLLLVSHGLTIWKSIN